MLLLCALVAGSGSVWAEDTLVETIDFTSANTDRPGISSYTTSSTWGNWTIVGAANNNKQWSYLRIGGGKKNSTPSTITRTTSGVSQAVDYIEINHEGRSGSTFSITSITAEASNSTDFTTPTATKTVSNPDISSAGKITITFDNQVAANSYYKITINWTQTNTGSNVGLNTDNVKFYQNASTDPSSAATFADETPSINFPATTTYSQTATTAIGYTGTVSYEITANTAGATISGSTVTVTQEGSVTVKATAPATDDFSQSTASYTLTVNDTRSANGLAYAESEQEVAVGEVLSAPTLTNPYNLDVTYASEDETIATVDESGNVTGVAIGTTNIIATFDGNGAYKAGSVSYSLTVKKAAFVITDGVFDFGEDEDYGSNLAQSGVKNQTSTWTAGNVTMYMAGRNCWYTSGTEIRLYKASGSDAAGSITLSVPTSYFISEVAFTGASLNKMSAAEGTYTPASDNKSATWTGCANSIKSPLQTELTLQQLLSLTLRHPPPSPRPSPLPAGPPLPLNILFPSVQKRLTSSTLPVKAVPR